MLATGKIWRRLGRVGSTVLCVATIAVAQATPAAAATKKVHFTFNYRLEGQKWDQKYGASTFTVTSCDRRNHASFHVNLVRSLWGKDNVMTGSTLKCAKGQRADFGKYPAGTYYLVFTKADDGEWSEGTGLVTHS
ncbi:hypothetical protein ACWD5R_39245 [Streptomyces sp. NPDC002514]|uniref:hypothetical protein n=1 Tax=unclassified Streptomyces TaxID=2593676 RepID=UPI00368DD96E